MKTPTNLNEKEKAFWQEYLDSISPSSHPVAPHIEAAFAGNQKITDELIALYLEGKKTAGSSLVEDFESCGDPLPKVGNFWIILDSKRNPGCIVKTLRVEIHRFGEITAEIARAEGEGDLSVEYWKRVHGALYTPFLSKWGIEEIEDARVITEFFEVVYAPGRGL